MRRALGFVVPIAFFVAVGIYVWTVDERAPSAADREIVRANVVREVPALAVPLRARLGGKVELAAVDQESTEAMPGEETKVTLYWRSLAKVSGDWKVFAHLDAPDGARANLDHDPVYGLHPISAWRRGEIVRDEVWITFDGRAERGDHVLWVGVFDEHPPHDRLPVDTAGEAMLDAEGRVRAAGWRVR